MDDRAASIFQCLSLLGLGLSECLAEMEAGGIPEPEAMEAILAQPAPGMLTAALGKARRGATLAQARPGRFALIAELVAREGIHPMSLLNWDGWEPDLARELLQAHWTGPGRPPLVLIGLGRVFCGDLRLLPRGLRLQVLSLARCHNLRQLPVGLEVQTNLECSASALRGVPSQLACGGNLVLSDLPDLASWGEGIRIRGDLVMQGVPRRAAPPRDLRVEGNRRLPEGWGRV